MKKIILFLVILLLVLQSTKVIAHEDKPVFVQVISSEVPAITGNFSFTVKYKFIDTTNFVRDAEFQLPDKWSANINPVIAGNIYLPGDSILVTVTVNYPTSNLPFYPQKIRILQYIPNQLEISVSTMIYFTPYNTIEIWSLQDYYNLPRHWLNIEHDPDAQRVYIPKDDIPVSNLDLSTPVNKDEIDTENNWQENFREVSISGLAYNILMKPVPPDSLEYYKSFGDGLDSSDTKKGKGKTFKGSVGGYLKTQIMFQRHYGGVADDYGCRVLQTDDGGYLVAAITESYGAGYGDIYLIKTNEFGDTLWTKTIGGLGDEQPNAMKKTNDGNFIIAGRTSSYGAGSSDCYLIKINLNGDTLWTKTYGGTNEENAYDVIQTTDNGFLIIGNTLSFTTGFSSVYAIKTNSNGDTIWTRTYEKKSCNGGFSVIQLTDGGYFYSGQTLLPGQLQTSDCYFIRTNSLGDTLWTKTYGGNDYDGAFQAYDAGNGIIISGTTKSFGAGGNDIFLGLFNYNGDEIWIKTYGGVERDYGGIFVPTNDNGYIITGYTESFGDGDRNMYLIKTDNNGDTLWTRTFGGEWGGCVRQTSDNGYIISGDISWYGKGYDVYLVKTNSDGISGFQQIIKPNSTCNIFPNPNNGAFTIQLDKAYSNVSIYVHDLNGRIVYSKNGLFDQLNTERIKLPDVSDGLYYVHLSSENINALKKIIIKK